MFRFRHFTAGLMACCLSVVALNNLPPKDVHAVVSEENALKYAEIAICATNDIRVANGLPELAALPALIDASQIRAVELLQINDHVRPDGSSPVTAVKEQGLTYFSIAENIASGRPDPRATVSQWMDSEKHRDNILSEQYTHIGVGYVYDSESVYGHYWTMFLIEMRDGGEPYIYEDQYLPERVLGDVNGSKSINASDASTILSYAAAEAVQLDTPVVSSFKNAADVNADGNINSIDASIILMYAAARGSGQDVELTDFIWR